MFNIIDKCDSFYANLHIAGNYDDAVRFAREYSYTKGYCVQISECDYVYTGGVESGMIVRVIRYPRFIKDINTIKNEFLIFSSKLAIKLCQKSYTVEFTDESIYFESQNEIHKK